MFPRYFSKLFLGLAVLASVLISPLTVGVAPAESPCSPVTGAITAPFYFDGAGTFCWQSNNLGAYVNSWNVASLTINGVNFTNVYVPSSSYPAQIAGYWYVSYNSTVAWGHFEAAGSGGATATNTAVVPTNTATRTPTSLVPSNTPTRTATATGGIPSNTPTRTPTRTATGPTPTRTRTRTPTRTATGPIPTNTATRTPTRTNTPLPPTATPTMTPIIDTHLSNPFVGAIGYVNPDWQGRTTFNVNTGVWLDSVAAVQGGNGYARSLQGHLDLALSQGANLITLVLYDLPNRNCASSAATTGEFLFAQDGFNRYKNEYIDLIMSVISNPAYNNLRLVVIVEPDSLHNLVVNLSVPKCQEANGPGGYRESIQYALNRLRTRPNVYSYLDIAHHGILGWDANFNAGTTLIGNMVRGAAAGASSVDGFITNTANYAAENELYHTANQLINGQPARFASFHEWNTYIDEATYATAWKNEMIGVQGFPAASANMLIDTSRNGWGGCSYTAGNNGCRPTIQSTSTDLNTFVNQSRIDRRYGKYAWCNQAAGIGKLPSANASAPFQAYVWVKPPGESDGSSSLIAAGPENPRGYGFDRMCDPNFTGFGDAIVPTGALPNSPVFGRWFPAAWDILVANKYP